MTYSVINPEKLVNGRSEDISVVLANFQAIESVIQSLVSPYEDYIPTALGVNIGSTGTTEGRFCRQGDTVMGGFIVTFGGAGINGGGSGVMTWNLPVLAGGNMGGIIGHGFWTDVSAPATYGFKLLGDGNTQQALMLYQAAFNGVFTQVKGDTPFTPAAGDLLWCQYAYEAA